MRKDSIQTRLIGMAFMFIMGTSITMGIIGMRLTTQFLNVRFHENFRLLSQYMARNAELGVLLKDKDMLGRLVQNLMEQEDIHGVTIYSGDGEILVDEEKGFSQGDIVKIEAKVNQLQFGNEDLMLYEYGQPEEVGRVILAYSRAGLTALKKKLALQFLFISIILSFFPVWWYWLIAKSIAAPLNDLLNVSKDVSNGQLDVRAQGGDFFETRTLATTFNEMLDAIKRHQEKLEKAHAEMAKQKALAEVGKFSMMVAHEIKNPLAILKGSLDIFKKDDMSPETKTTMLMYMEDEIGRINRLMEDFLMFARPREPDFIDVEINAFVKELTDKTGVMGTEGRIKLDIDEQACIISCDIHLMERAMLNIIRNAMEVTGKSGGIELITRNDGNFWKFLTIDSGAGIKPEHLQKLFEPFFTTKAKGTGLGLAITKEIIETHGGSIEARNHDGGGACFEIRLPR